MPKVKLSILELEVETLPNVSYHDDGWVSNLPSHANRLYKMYKNRSLVKLDIMRLKGAKASCAYFEDHSGARHVHVYADRMNEGMFPFDLFLMAHMEARAVYYLDVNKGGALEKILRKHCTSSEGFGGLGMRDQANVIGLCILAYRGVRVGDKTNPLWEYFLEKEKACHEKISNALQWFLSHSKQEAPPYH